MHETKLIPRMGPLLDFGPRAPQWLSQWEHDTWNLHSFVCYFSGETAIRRYTGRVRMWEICARGNSGGALTLSEEQRLGLVAKPFETALRIDARRS